MTEIDQIITPLIEETCPHCNQPANSTEKLAELKKRIVAIGLGVEVDLQDSESVYSILQLLREQWEDPGLIITRGWSHKEWMMQHSEGTGMSYGPISGLETLVISIEFWRGKFK